jgi:hypothetical protein
MQLVPFLSPNTCDHHLGVSQGSPSVAERESMERLWRAIAALILHRLPPISCDSPQQAVCSRDDLESR